MVLINKIRELKQRLNDTIGSRIYFNKIHAHHRLSYSQEGEDLVIESILFNKFNGFKTNGFYIDVGAHHPQKYSNTYYFYRKGWRGINIDALPGSMKRFNEIRPNDINLEIPVANKNEILTYYEFNEPAVNSFDYHISQKRNNFGDFKLIGQREIECYKLSQILDTHLPKDTQIDFLTVDVEGLDLQVLKSNDWDRYRPFLVLAEELDGESFSDKQQSELNLFMCLQGYNLISRTFNTLFYRKNE